MADRNETGYDRIYLARANEQELIDNKDKIRSNEVVIAKDSHRVFHKGEDGTLNKIVSNYIFDTIADLQNADYLIEGDIVEVLGYYKKSDGAGHKRKIETTDDGSGISTNSKWANLIHNGIINVSWLGGDFSKVSYDNTISEVKGFANITEDITFTGLENITFETDISITNATLKFLNCDGISIMDSKLIFSGKITNNFGQGYLVFENSKNVNILRNKFFEDSIANVIYLRGMDNDYFNFSNNYIEYEQGFFLYMKSRDNGNNEYGELNDSANNGLKVSNNIFNCTGTRTANILLLDCDYSKISNNIAKNFYTFVAIFYARNIEIASNDLRDFASNGICIGNGTDDLIIGYNVHDNFLDSYSHNINHGINVYKQGGDVTNIVTNFLKSRNGIISNNTVKNMLSYGIFLYGQGNCKILNNKIFACGIGVSLISPYEGETEVDSYYKNPGNISIIGNTVDTNNIAHKQGIAVGNSALINSTIENVQITDNSIYNNVFQSIMCTRCKDFLVDSNAIYDSSSNMYVNTLQGDLIIRNNKFVKGGGYFFSSNIRDSITFDNNSGVDSTNMTFTTNLPQIYDIFSTNSSRINKTKQSKFGIIKTPTEINLVEDVLANEDFVYESYIATPSSYAPIVYEVTLTISRRSGYDVNIYKALITANTFGTNNMVVTDIVGDNTLATFVLEANKLIITSGSFQSMNPRQVNCVIRGTEL